jgi:hypothetical protein
MNPNGTVFNGPEYVAWRDYPVSHVPHFVSRSSSVPAVAVAAGFFLGCFHAVELIQKNVKGA